MTTAAAVLVLAGCSAGSQASVATRVLGESTSRPAACSGWFQMSGSTLLAHLKVTDAARRITLNATFDDGSSRRLAPPVAAARAGDQTIRYRGVDGTVVGVSADLDARGQRVSCTLANPH